MTAGPTSFGDRLLGPEAKLPAKSCGVIPIAASRARFECVPQQHRIQRLDAPAVAEPRNPHQCLAKGVKTHEIVLPQQLVPQVVEVPGESLAIG